jgi:hypothetical protein
VSARDDFLGHRTPSSLSADLACDHFVIGGEKIQPAADTLFTRSAPGDRQGVDGASPLR